MIGIIDYNCGNIASVTNALDHLSMPSEVVSSAEKLKHYDSLILPGVGSFANAMNKLNKRNLSDAIVDSIEGGMKFLGICVGMQVLFEKGYEASEINGLSFFKGSVEKIQDLKTPSVGWYSVVDHDQNHYGKFYFTHSFAANCEEKSSFYYELKGKKIIAGKRYNNVLGVQFHPERSGLVGLNFLRDYLT